jgi:7-keto-8-aminopelargonate synthetase-like enzyme
MILEGSIGSQILSNGRKFTYFGGNNYLGLANHRVLKAESVKAIRKYGINFSASRRTTGTADIHLLLEHELSAFKNKSDTVVYASGYLGNSILHEVFRGSFTRVCIDELAHSSLFAGIPREIRDVHKYRHCDPDHLNMLLAHGPQGKTLVLTDGVFALTGEIAPLDRIFPVVARHKAILVVDEAHATGILGENGRGTTEHFNLGEAEIYQTETMSKALGGYGGFISGSHALTERIRKNSSIYGASTALPPPIVAAGIAALGLIKENPGWRKRLASMALSLKQEIARLGYCTNQFETPIVPVFLRSQTTARELAAFLEQEGIIAPFMDYPGNHSTSMIRISLSLLHTPQQITNLLERLDTWKCNR